MTPAKAASFSKSAQQDQLTVTTLNKALASTGRLDVSNIVAHDKRPNFDGVVEVFSKDKETGDFQPVGIVRVQVKTMGARDRAGATLTLRDKKVMAAIERTMGQVPTVILAVDTVGDRIYWRHVGLKEAKAELKRSQQTKFVFQPQEKVVQGEEDYIDEWVRLIRDHQERHQLGEQVASSASLRGLATPVIDLAENEVGAVQDYLREYNLWLAGPLRNVRSRIIGKAHQVGLAYHDFSEGSVTYSIFGQPRGKVDSAIQKITTNDIDKLMQATRAGYSWNNGNGILHNPERKAREDVQKQLNGVLTRRRFVVDHSTTFAQDFLHTLLEAAPFCLRRARQSRKVADLEADLNDLGGWMENALDILADQQGKKVDPGLLARDSLGRHVGLDPLRVWRMLDKTRQGRLAGMASRAQKQPLPPIAFAAFPTEALRDCLARLKEDDIANIDSPWGKAWDSDPWKWTKEQVEQNLAEFLPIAQRDFVAFVERNLEEYAARFLKRSLFDAVVVSHPIVRPGTMRDGVLKAWEAELRFRQCDRTDGIVEGARWTVTDDVKRYGLDNWVSSATFQFDGHECESLGAGFKTITAPDFDGPALFKHHYTEMKRILDNGFKRMLAENDDD